MGRYVFYCFVLLLCAAPMALAQMQSQQQDQLPESQENSVVAAVIVEGASVFPGERLFPIYADNLGRSLTPEAAQGLRERVIELYADRGFLAPDVSLRTHPDAAEVVIVAVSEPRIRHLSVTGTDARQTAAIAERAQAIRQRSAVSRADIDALVADIERTLGLAMTASVERQAGASDYLLLLDLATRVEGQVLYSAEGSDRLGQHMVGARITVHNPGAGLSQAYLSALHTLESAGYRTIGIGLDARLNLRDRLHLDTSFARAVPQDRTASPATVYRRQWARIKWSRSLQESRGRDTSLLASLSLRDYTRKEGGTREEGDITEIDERLRMAELGVQTLGRGAQRASRAWVSGRLGVDALGAQREGTQAGNRIDTGFQLVEAGYTFWHVLPADFSMRLDLAGQYSADDVPYSQRFSIGGSRYARAYEPGEFSGDSGAGAKLELRRGFETQALGRARLVPYVYYGVATAYENASNDRDSGAAAGLGLRVLARQVSAFLEFGKPLTADSDYKDDSARTTGRLTYSF